MQSEAMQTTRFTQLWFRALVQTTVSRKGGRKNETNYPYSSSPPPIPVAKPNQQKGGGGGGGGRNFE